MGWGRAVSPSKQWAASLSPPPPLPALQDVAALNGLYRVRVPRRPGVSDDPEAGGFVSSFIPAVSQQWASASASSSHWLRPASVLCPSVGRQNLDLALPSKVSQAVGRQTRWWVLRRVAQGLMGLGSWPRRAGSSAGFERCFWGHRRGWRLRSPSVGVAWATAPVPSPPDSAPLSAPWWSHTSPTS